MSDDAQGLDERSSREIAHGRALALGDAEAQWGWSTPAGRQRAERRAELIAAGGRLATGKRVLEIGCGTGNFTRRFVRWGASILAVDVSPDLLAIAEARGLPADRARFILSRFEDCDVHGPFDAVIGSSVLHHLNMSLALLRIRDLLVPGGWLSFAEPNMLNPQIFLERHARCFFPQVSPDETAFVRSSLRRELTRAGFEDVRIAPFDWLHPATPPALIGAVKRAGRLLEATPLLREFSGSLLIVARAPASGSHGRVGSQ